MQTNKLRLSLCIGKKTMETSLENQILENLISSSMLPFVIFVYANKQNIRIVSSFFLTFA